jgi:hypothetical protein
LLTFQIVIGLLNAKADFLGKLDALLVCRISVRGTSLLVGFDEARSLWTYDSVIPGVAIVTRAVAERNETSANVPNARLKKSKNSKRTTHIPSHLVAHCR